MRGDDVTDAGGALVLPADDADHLGLAGAGVVGDRDFGFHLDHKPGDPSVLMVRVDGVASSVGEDFEQRPALQLAERAAFLMRTLSPILAFASSSCA